MLKERPEFKESMRQVLNSTCLCEFCRIFHVLVSEICRKFGCILILKIVSIQKDLSPIYFSFTNDSIIVHKIKQYIILEMRYISGS